MKGLGNHVVYGLAAGVWTQNMRRALRMAERLQRCAARTARSASSTPQRGMRAQGLPVYGLSVSKNSPDAESTRSPAITVWYLVKGMLA